MSSNGLPEGESPLQPDETGSPITLKSPRQRLEPEQAPRAPKRSRHARNPFVVAANAFFSLIVLTFLAAGAVIYWGSSEYRRPGPLTEPQTVLIPNGLGSNEIASLLERNGVISSVLVFRLAVQLQNIGDDLKAGEYLFESGSTMNDVVAKLESGKSIIHKVTLPEGFSSLQIVEVLRNNELLTGDIEEVPVEGSLLPDTYTFTRGTQRGRIIEQMKSAQAAAVNRIWSGRVRGLPISTPDELVTLASIVEKETGKADERPRVAAVFINRLDRGMKLQSDPTIIYGLFGGAGKPKDRPIYKSDIEKATPYNTYVIDALPPGPIANPGVAAMEAVANPSTTDELFFVADGTGGHAFAKTLDEHNRNVRRWRQIEAERREAARKRAAEGEAEQQ
ncbi:MAG: endolytic transglycosylase MltG [Pseudomonadota bacterium]